MCAAAFFRIWADEGERFSPRMKLGFVDQAIGNRGPLKTHNFEKNKEEKLRFFKGFS